MSNFFHENNPVIVFLGDAFDLMLLNLLTLVCCLPVVTIGAAFTAMHYVLVCGVEQKKTGILKPFFSAFRKNFLQATVVWMLLLGVFAMLFACLLFTDGNGAVLFLAVFIGLLAAMILFYAFPLLAHYENTISGTVYNALCVAVSHIPQTGALFAIAIVYAMFFSRHWQTVSAFLCLFGISVPGWLYMKLYLPVFQEFENR